MKKNNQEFIDKDHEVIELFYHTVDNDALPQSEILSKMKKLISIDKYYLDPYLICAEQYLLKNDIESFDKYIFLAYKTALKIITDSKGNLPNKIDWGYLENRHILRAIEKYCIMCWRVGKINEALSVFHLLLKLNPNDNQGARYNILAIRLNLNFETWEKQFESPTMEGFLLAHKINKWFDKNAKKFPNDFKDFFVFHGIKTKSSGKKQIQ